MICLKDVSKIYNQGKANETQALQHVTLTIKKGDMVAITGPSGSGKSTLLHICLLYTSPSPRDTR